MRVPVPFVLSLAALLLTAGCNIRKQGDDAADAANSTATNGAAPAAAAAPQASPSPSAAASPAAFDPLSVPESGATLPPFPLFKPLERLTSDTDPKDANRAFDRDYFIAGDTPVAVEGKVFHASYNLAADRPYSAIEFQRNYRQAIEQLGGVHIGGPLDTGRLRDRFDAMSPPPTTACIAFGCDADFYLIRQAGKQWWISVGTGAVPLHGYVTVLEKQAMAKSFAFIDADALKSALDARGRVPVYIEFDLDKSSLRPSASPQIDAIVTLLRRNPALNLSIEGHTDDSGTPAHNRTLSLARAEVVRARLLVAGIDPARLKTAGFGADRPLVPGSDEDARARNRRVELVKF